MCSTTEKQEHSQAKLAIASYELGAITFSIKISNYRAPAISQDNVWSQ